MNKNRITGILLILFGLFIIIVASQIPNPNLENDVGPRIFPYISGIGLIFCGAGIALKKEEKGKPYLTSEGWKRLMVMAVVVVLYAISLNLLGFLIATPIVLYATIRILGMNPKAYLKTVIVSVAMTAIIYAVFEKVLSVMLPSGMFF